MYSVRELNVMKGRDADARRTVIDSLTQRFAVLWTGQLSVLVEATRDGLLDLSTEEPEQVIRYCLFAMYAADIATVPAREFRDGYIRTLDALAAEYGLQYDKIVHLSTRADRLFAMFSEKEDATK
jgi:hypothetical protein